MGGEDLDLQDLEMVNCGLVTACYSSILLSQVILQYRNHNSCSGGICNRVRVDSINPRLELVFNSQENS